MLGRRVFLGAGLLGAATSLLPGCALTPGGEVPLAPSPSAALLPGQVALLELRAALAQAGTLAWPAPRDQVVAWALGVTADQLVAVSLPAASPAPTPAPSQPEAGPDAATSLAAALAAASGAFRAQALDDGSARPWAWASMAAWAGVTAGLLARPDVSLEPARAALDPPRQSAAEAVQAALDAAAEAAYGLQEAAGTLGLSADEVTVLRGRITAWHALRDALLAAVAPTPDPSATATPTPGPTPARPWYRVDRPADADAARTLAARIEAATLPVLGRSLAWGPAGVRAACVDAIVATAAEVPRWGGLVERWPGLPR